MSANWQKPEKTRSFALRFMAWVVRLFGRAAGRICLPFILLYYMVFAGAARAESRRYLERMLPRVRRRDVYRHIHTFASVLLDRVFLLTGGLKKLSLELHGEEVLANYRDQSQGCLLFVAHVGSFDVMRVAADEIGGLPVHILMNKGVSSRVVKILDSLNPEMANQIIDVSERGPEVIFKVKDALDADAMVGVMADRVFSAEEPTVEVDFLGGKATLPATPWLLASSTKVPVVACFGLYLGGNRYRVEFVEITPRLKLNRADKLGSIQVIAQEYANRLEEQLRLAPYNWFNFYDFWESR